MEIHYEFRKTDAEGVRLDPAALKPGVLKELIDTYKRAGYTASRVVEEYDEDNTLVKVISTLV